jgi:diadenosine tetraphosphate (Ap4A) HIT family hydrolase
MTTVGDVIAAECRPLRMNYSIVGNELPILHAHIRPRYQWEPDEYRTGPAFQYPAEIRQRDEHSWRKPRHLELMRRLAARFESPGTHG